MTTVRDARPGLLVLDDGRWLFKSEYHHTDCSPKDWYPMVFNTAGEFVVREAMDLQCREVDPDDVEVPEPRSRAADALVPIVRSWLVAAFTKKGEAEQQERARNIVRAIVELIDERIEEKA